MESFKVNPAVGHTAAGFTFIVFIALLYFLSFRYQVIDHARLGQC